MEIQSCLDLDSSEASLLNSKFSKGWEAIQMNIQINTVVLRTNQTQIKNLKYFKNHCQYRNKRYTIGKPYEIATRNAKETFEFLRISWILQAFLEK